MFSEEVKVAKNQSFYNTFNILIQFVILM